MKRRPPSAAWLSPLGVFAVALGMRLLVPLTSSGLPGNYSYDASVYYSAGASLLYGRVPYRDFILLHPPGVMLAMTPAASIGTLTSDRSGFAVATLAFMVFGAASAALVVIVARGLGAGWHAAAAGGLFYALWLPSVRAEYVSRLEPLGNMLLLCGLLAYTGIDGPRGRRCAVLCGAALGAATAVKIWYAAPLVVVLGFLVGRGRARDAGRTAIGAGTAIAVMCAPFFALAPSGMWRMVVTAQLGRESSNPLRGLMTLHDVPASLSWPGALLIDAGLAAAVAVLLIVAWRAPRVRLPAVLLLVSGAVLVAAPSWYVNYADFLAPALGLSVATGATAIAAATKGSGRWQPRLAGTGAAAIVALVVLVAPAKPLWFDGPRRGAALPDAAVVSAVRGVRCVVSDSPMALIGLNALHRGLANDCPNWVDVTGRTYASDMDVRHADGRPMTRASNPRWQAALRAYLLSGDAVIIVRSRSAGISASTWNALRRGGVLATDGTHVVYRVAAQPDAFVSPVGSPTAWACVTSPPRMSRSRTTRIFRSCVTSTAG